MTEIFTGAGGMLPVILGYTVFAYQVFWVKSTALKLRVSLRRVSHHCPA